MADDEVQVQAVLATFDAEQLERDIQKRVKWEADPRIVAINAAQERAALDTNTQSYVDGIDRVRAKYAREDRRYQIAAAALQGLLAAGHDAEPESNARLAVRYADELLAELEK